MLLFNGEEVSQASSSSLLLSRLELSDTKVHEPYIRAASQVSQASGAVAISFRPVWTLHPTP